MITHVIERSKATKQSILSAMTWIASRSLSSGAHWRDPLARNDGASPRRGTLHRRLTFRIRDPHLHAGVGVVGIDGKFTAFEQRLHPAIAEFFRRRAAMNLR